MTACAVAFAHGGNDVANALGPFYTIWMLYSQGSVSTTTDIPVILAMIGGSGIVIGLAIWCVPEAIFQSFLSLNLTGTFSGEHQ